jgi:hypothetical protein
MGWLFRSNRAKVADRVALPDEDYLAEFGLPEGRLARRVALAVRTTVAAVGQVDPLFIRASDRYPDELGVLPNRDSLDFLDWMFRLEMELRLKVPRTAYDVMSFPFSVKDMARAAYEHVSRQGVSSGLSAEPGRWTDSSTGTSALL